MTGLLALCLEKDNESSIFHLEPAYWPKEKPSPHLETASQRMFEQNWFIEEAEQVRLAFFLNEDNQCVLLS